MIIDEPPPGTPSGSPVGRAILVRPGPLEAAMRSAVEAVDQVHGDGRLVRIPMGPIPLKQSNMVGAFFVSVVGGHPLGIAVDPDADEPEMVCLHEIGHFIDYQGLGAGRGFASGTSQVLERWRREVRATKAFRVLEENRGYLSACVEAGGRRHTVPLDPAYVESTLSTKELFARSYAQFIALKSHSAVLQEQLDRVRARPISQVFPLQWPDADFERVAASLDQAFRSMRWII